MKNLIRVLTRTFLVLVLLISCSKDNPIQFSLTVQVSPSEGGGISPLSGIFEEGEVVQITATPSSEFLFKYWEGAGTGTNNPISILMNSDKTIKAVFEKKQYPLTIEVEGEGTVKEEILSSKPTKDYPSGATVQLTAEPNQGWMFVEWSEDLTGTDNPKSIKVDSPKNVKATFEPVLYKQILGKWDVRQSAKPEMGSKGVEEECIVYSIVFNADGSFVLTLNSGQISGTFYFDSSNSIVLNNKGKFDNLHINNNVLNFHLNLNNLCSSDGTADEDDDHNEGDCVSFLECNDGKVFVRQLDNGYSFIKISNHFNEQWIEYYEVNSDWGCKTEEYDNLDNEHPITMLSNIEEELKYEVKNTEKGDGIISLKPHDENSILVIMNFDNDQFDEESYYEKDTQGLLNEYLSWEKCRLTYIPDDNFEQALIDYGYDDVLDNYVLTSNIEYLDNIDLHGREIADATGIEDFLSLSGLHIHQNNLSSIDLSGNSNLLNLWIHDNKLESLDISNNLNLNYLFAELNDITEIDLSKNNNLVHLAISANPLGSIDVTNNKKLVRLEVNNTLLESLNITENLELVYLDMNNFNPLSYQHTISSIDLSSNPELIVLISNHTKLSSIDLSSNSKLEHLEIFDTDITELDVSNMNNLIRLEAFFNNINCIKVNENQLSSIPDTWIKDESTIYSLDCQNTIYFMDDLNDCDISDCTYSGGSTIATTQNGLDGCGLYMTHYAGDEIINFYHSEREFSYGNYEVDALSDNNISDNNIYLFQKEEMSGGILLSFRPNSTDNPGFSVIDLERNEAIYETNHINVGQDEWYHIKLKVEPSMITVYINDENMYSFSIENINIPNDMKWRFKLGVAFSGVFDNIEYTSF